MCGKEENCSKDQEWDLGARNDRKETRPLRRMPLSYSGHEESQDAARGAFVTFDPGSWCHNVRVFCPCIHQVQAVIFGILDLIENMSQLHVLA